MSGLERRPGSRPTRRQRRERCYQLAIAGGVAGVVAVVGFALAIFGVVGFGIPLLAAVVALVCMLVFRRTVGS